MVSKHTPKGSKNIDSMMQPIDFKEYFFKTSRPSGKKSKKNIDNRFFPDYLGQETSRPDRSRNFPTSPVKKLLDLNRQESPFMFIVQKKNQYAIRAIFELAKHWGKGPVKISEIAKAQAIPTRFLEVILGQLKKSGFVTSKRGFYGGYSLVPRPDRISVGDLLRFMEGDDIVLDCMNCETERDCPFDRKCAFLPMWRQVKQAIFKIYDETRIQDLLDNETRAD